MTAMAKSAKRHPAAKKCCDWEEPAICQVCSTLSSGRFWWYLVVPVGKQSQLLVGLD